MNTSTPSVAIIIAAFNAEATIARAITSALAEPEVREIYVVDDCSSDQTAQNAKLADDGSGRLTILRRTSNAGPSVARNMALMLTKADWVGILDADDFFLPGRIAALLTQAENADLLADDMWQVSERHINGPRTPLLAMPLSTPMNVDFSRFVDSAIPRKGRMRGELSFIKPLMRHSLMKHYHVRYQEQLHLGEDFEIYARLLGVGGRLVVIPHRGYVSVVRPNSLSAKHSAHDLTLLRDCHDAMRDELPLSNQAYRILEQHRLAIDKRAQWRLLIEAVKQNDPMAALQCFAGAPSTSWYLLKHLLEQVYLRGRYGSHHVREMAGNESMARHEGNVPAAAL